MGLQIAIPKREWPKEIIVEASRLAMGIWGEAKGDIQAAYCADTFPKVKTFVHDGHLFTNCGGLAEESMQCYPLIPEQYYDGPEPARFTYEGRAAVHRGERVRLGPQVSFIARDRSPAEWANLLQREYAHGGYFAAGKTYGEVLHYLAERHRISPSRKQAIENELAGSDLPKTQAEMLERLAKESAPAKSRQPADFNQLSLPGL